jgi:hypothetical protein
MSDGICYAEVSPSILPIFRITAQDDLHIHQEGIGIFEVILSQANSHWQDGLGADSVALHPFGRRSMTLFVDYMSCGDYSTLYCTRGESGDSAETFRDLGESYTFYFSCPIAPSTTELIQARDDVQICTSRAHVGRSQIVNFDERLPKGTVYKSW